MAEVPASSLSANEVLSSVPITRIQNGESACVAHISTESQIGKRLMQDVQLIDHLWSNGPEDANAPKIGKTLVRTSEQVALSGGDAPELHNDGACDSYPVIGKPKYIGALALGGDEKGTMIVWPRDSSFVDVCVFSNMEPKADHGVILFATDSER